MVWKRQLISFPIFLHCGRLMWLLVLLFTELFIKIEPGCTKARCGYMEGCVIYFVSVSADLYVHVYRCEDEGDFVCTQWGALLNI